MELTQRVVIPVNSGQVWQALNDPEILGQSIAGCESFEMNDAGGYDLTLQVKMGPVKARFKGEIELSDVVEGVSCTLNGSGKGGVAGHARGSARVHLTTVDATHTSMRYSVQANVGGKLAQIGSRLVDGAARKMANDFFTRFVYILCQDDSVEINLETIEE